LTALPSRETYRVDDLPILGRDDERHFFQQVTTYYDAPAYVRRARQVHEALDRLLERCRQQRDEWSTMVVFALGTLKGLAGDWSSLRPLLRNDAQLERLGELWTLLKPRPRLPVEPTSSTPRLRRALRELVQSLERFNRRWAQFLLSVNLDEINELRDSYNRYYILEKECSVRSPRLARQGFAPLQPLDLAKLTALLPPFPVPELQA
jgi:hypothetical protein